MSPSRVSLAGLARIAPEDVSSSGFPGGGEDGKNGVREGRVMIGSTLK